MAKAKPQLAVLPPLPDADDWRAARAVSFEVYVRSFERQLGIDGINQELLLELGETRVAADLRVAAAGLREVCGDLNDTIRRLRAVDL